MKMISQSIRIIGLAVMAGLILSNCERDITVEIPLPEQQIVVEGTIESDQPPFVILNTNFPYFGTFSLETYQQSFVHNAKVEVSDGETKVELSEICWSTLEETQRELLSLVLGSAIPDSITSENFDYCVYSLPLVDLISGNTEFIGKAGKTYFLSIQTEDGQMLSAHTTIPNIVALDSLWLEQHPGEEYDSLWQVWGQLVEPDTVGNFYRVFTSRNQEGFLPPLSSVFDDLIVNGVTFFFPINRGEERSAELDIDTYGYFAVGDVARVKWCSIDAAAYQFWRTLEFGANTTGPLSSQTQIKSNIEGGIGIWVGYGAAIHEIVIEE